MLQEIAVTARATLSADRATCYACDVRGRTVAAVYTTEEDPARRAVLARAIGRGAAELPVWRLQMHTADPLLVVEDLRRDRRLPAGLAGRLGTSSTPRSWTAMRSRSSARSSSPSPTPGASTTRT
jgi:hypothetical protein